MATTIQILVAGSLLLAWVWVLGRPLVGGGTVRRSDYRDLDRDFVARPGTEVAPPRQIQAIVARWGRWEPEARRRQLMLATMFALFASFLLAIAFRGIFVSMFLLMVGVFAFHVAVASYLGARLIEDRRATFVAHAKRSVRLETGTISIKAHRVGPDQPEVVSSDAVLDAAASQASIDAEPTGPGVTKTKIETKAETETETETETADLLEELFAPGSSTPAVRRPARSSFEVAKGLASELEPSPDGGQPMGATSFVSALIESEWGDDEQLVEPITAEPEEEAVSDEAEAEVPSQDETEEEAVSDEPEVPNPPAEDDSVVAESSEPIFIRAAKDEPARTRKRAQPIYIEDQLEDEDEDDAFPTAKAVNHP